LSLRENVDWRARASFLGIGRPAPREHEVAIRDAESDEPFVYRGAGAFMIWAAGLDLEQSLSFDHLGVAARTYGIAVALFFGTAGAVGMLFPHGLARLIRGQPALVIVAAVLSVPLLVIPAGGQFAPARPGILLLTGLACGFPPRRTAIALACSVAALEVGSILLFHSFAELRATRLLGYELVVIPAGIIAAGFVGSIIGEASIVSRSLGETLRRETGRRQRMEEHVGALRAAVNSLLGAVPEIITYASELGPAERADVLEAVARTRRRAGDVVRSAITVETGAPRTFGEDIDWISSYQRTLDRDVSIEVGMDAACRTAKINDAARASLRVAVGRALDNACAHAGPQRRVQVAARIATGALRVSVTNADAGVGTIEWGRGLNGSQRELRRFGGDLDVVVHAATAQIRWHACLPIEGVGVNAGERAGVTREADSTSDAGRVRELLAAVLRVWRIAAVAMVLGSTLLDPRIITAHQAASQLLIAAGVAATEFVAFVARRGDWERPGALVRCLIAVLLCAYVTHGERSPLAGWATIITCEVLWHAGWRAYSVSVVATVGALIVSLAVPPGQNASRGLWSEALLPLWAAPIAAVIVFFIARTTERERRIGTAAQAAWTLTDLAIRCANAHALVQLLRLAVASRFAPEHPARLLVLDRTQRVDELCAAAPGGARSRDATLREIAAIVAHRISPASCLIRDYTALPLESANRPDARSSAAAGEASLLSLLAAAAEEMARRTPTDRLGRTRLERVLVVLQDHEAGSVEVSVTAVPTPGLERPGSRLLAHVALAGGQLVSGDADANLIITVPGALLNS
jgi:hypothetical protein